MTNAEQWNVGFAKGLTDARNKPQDDVRKSYDRCLQMGKQYPYAFGYVEGVKEAKRLDGRIGR